MSVVHISLSASMMSMVAVSDDLMVTPGYALVFTVRVTVNCSCSSTLLSLVVRTVIGT